jgi:NodT family efflux transporter outer membrane factor (OMF) lipoprotein
MTALRNLIIPCLVLGALAAGCAAEKTAPLQRELPAAFDAPAGENTGKWPAQDWYRGFASDQLNSLIAQAAAGNFDLAGARARMAQANARARQAGAALLPTVDAVGNASFLSGHSTQGSGHELDWSAMLSASYEIDFWGKNRASLRSAVLLANASKAERDTVALTTLAAVANGYFQVLALHERVEIARASLDAAHKLLDVVQARFDAKIDTPVELASQRSAFDTAQIAVSDLQTLEGEARSALAVLLGRLPESFDVKTVPLDSLSEPAIGPGLPSELLTRRPDILAAESNLRAAHADLIVARAAMFPTLNLTASGGVANPALPATVLTIPGVGPSFALGANLVQPIFNHGRLKAQREEVEAKNTELLSVYRAAIVSAFVDVENSLAAIQHLDASRQYEIDSIAQSERAYEGAKMRYQVGLADFLLMLQAQQNLYIARDRFVQAKLARLQALVGLCKALGGGWGQQSGPETPAKSLTWNMNR